MLLTKIMLSVPILELDPTQEQLSIYYFKRRIYIYANNRYVIKGIQRSRIC